METSRPAELECTPQSDPVREQIRGSSLLLTGRLVALGINFVSQVLIVHYLSTREYGAWAYGLSIVAFCQAFATLGLNRSVPRFIPIYEEREDYNSLFGTILLVLIGIGGMGIVVVGGLHAFPQIFSHLVRSKGEQPISLLFVLIFLVPIQASDGVLMALFACFASAKAIFLRKYILAPGLQLTAVALLIASHNTTVFLAWGYVLAAVIGVLIYGWVLVRQWQIDGLLKRFSFKTLTIPFQEIFAFTIPLMSSDVVNALMAATDALMLGYFCNMSEVAIFRVVMPLALLNKLAQQTFCIMYTPLAARLFAKGDSEGIEDLYWRTAIWMAALSFPIFAVTFSLAHPLTILLYGHRYARSGLILSLLSIGFYFNVALGFNDLTIQVFGRLRYVVLTNFAAAVCNVGVNWVLIPRYGALGAAIGTATTYIVLNLFLQAGLKIVLGFSVLKRQYLPFYGVIGAGTVGLFCVTILNPVHLFVSVPLTLIMIVAVLAMARKMLNFAEMFPELVRIPLMRLLFT